MLFLGISQKIITVILSKNNVVAANEVSLSQSYVDLLPYSAKHPEQYASCNRL